MALSMLALAKGDPAKERTEKVRLRMALGEEAHGQGVPGEDKMELSCAASLLWEIHAPKASRKRAGRMLGPK